jgi:nitrogen-specific signal transduction histidine kinase
MTARQRTRHELNNLLGKIMGAAELALDRVRDPAARAELQLMIRCAEKAARLLDRDTAAKAHERA